MAKKEIVELPDKHTGDIQELRDKLIALASDATGASDITSQCEYLIKNGQTGEFMNVLKNYIDESIRSALGALVNNLDKGISISKILATDASNDLGSITPANLASVLGVHIEQYGMSPSEELIIGTGCNLFVLLDRNGNNCGLYMNDSDDGIIRIYESEYVGHKFRVEQYNYTSVKITNAFESARTIEIIYFKR